MDSQEELLHHLQSIGVLRTPAIIQAFNAIDRRDFVTSEMAAAAYEDTALPLGLGQTISQPYTVAFMLELLQSQPNESVLEIGSGSGYVAALLSQIVGKKGRVVAVERLKAITKQAQENLRGYGFKQLKVITADGSLGYPDYAPYNRIIISAAAREIPESMEQQLAPGGRIVAPVGIGEQAIVVLERRGNRFVRQSYPGFVFVPLISGRLE